MYRQQNHMSRTVPSAECPKCGSKRLLMKGRRLSCTNCGETIGSTFNKYGAKRTEFNGKIYDSKFEASVAEDLETQKLAKEIVDYDTQFRIEATAYRADGTPAFTVRHKVDFRVHHHDGSFELLEAKGVETTDYRWRRKFLEEIWLKENPEYTYTVVKQNRRR
jgi:DNA-directed RNA polymerase subunit RPC12/RpoP